MSTTETVASSEETLAAAPEFDLSCLVDDLEDPTEVTIYNPRGQRTVTEWMTAPLADTVDVESVR
jgi:hypothetical protein